LIGNLCAALGDFIKLAAFNEFHAEIAGAVTLADFVDWNDTRML
jgi:hypothetical protein